LATILFPLFAKEETEAQTQHMTQLEFKSIPTKQRSFYSFSCLILTRSTAGGYIKKDRVLDWDCLAGSVKPPARASSRNWQMTNPAIYPQVPILIYFCIPRPGAAPAEGTGVF
jgi:hypothetical protein